MNIVRKSCYRRRAGNCLVITTLLCAPVLYANDWYVKAKAGQNGDGSKNRPFNSLLHVEMVSAAGDTVYIIQSPASDVLDGGIQLKDGQKLIGLGPNVTLANQNSARAKLTNTTSYRYNGDIVRLAKNNIVENIHFDNAWRSSIFGINANGAEIHDNLVTNDMAVHDLFAIEGPAPSTCAVVGGAGMCTGEWPNGLEAGLPVVFDADISVTNARPAPNPPIDVWIDNNYWGGGMPVISTAKGQDVYAPAQSNVVVHAPASFLSTDPKRTRP